MSSRYLRQRTFERQVRASKEALVVLCLSDFELQTGLDGAVHSLEFLCKQHADALENIQKTFGSRLAGPDFSSVPLSRAPELVISIGASSRPCGVLYSRITGRNHLHLETVEELRIHAAPTVVVTTINFLTYELMEYLYRPGLASVPGIIAANSSVLLLRQALVRAWALRLSELTDSTVLDLLPLLDLAVEGTAKQRLLGGRATTCELMSAVTSATSIVRIDTHSDGIDAFLGSSTLCGVKAVVTRRTDRPPACVATGVCHRLGLPLQEALDDPRTIDPHSIRAGLLLLQSCHGLFLHPSFIPSEWQLGHALLNSTAIGALMLSFEQSVSSITDCDELLSSVVTGKSLGSALASFLSTKDAIMKRQRFCLFGDPAMAFPSQERPAYLRSRRAKTTWKKSNSMVLAQATLLRHLVLTQSDQLPPEKKVSADTTLKAIENYEREVARTNELSDARKQAGVIMRAKVLEIVTCLPSRISHFWAHLAYDMRVHPAQVRCWACGGAISIITARLRLPGTISRRILTCNHCATIQDSPSEKRVVKFGYEGDRTFTLDSDLYARTLDLRLVCDTPLLANRSVWSWPRSKDGSPLREFRLPSDLPPGPFYAALFVLDDTSLSVLRVRLRGETGLNA